MAIIRSVRGFDPKFGRDCFLADTATVIGDVVMGDECSVWFNAIIRGDVNSIRIGSKVNVQDGAVVHCTYQKTKTIIGDNVSIGHNAIVHGCKLVENVLVGMGSIVMDNAVVNKNCLIAAGAVVLEDTIVEEGSVYAGVPAKKIKSLSPEQFEVLIKGIADNYITYSGWYK